MAYAAVTLAQLRTSAGLRWEDTPFWTTADIDDAINEGLRVWNMLTGYWKTTANITTVANQHFYTLNTSLTYATIFHYQNNPIMQDVSKSIDNGRPTWQSETTASGGDVPTVPKMWMKFGVKLVAFWPAPALVQTIVAEGVAKTPVLSAAGDFVDIGEEELAYIEGYAIHRASLKLGGDVWKSTFHFYREFIEGASIRNEFLKASSFYRRVMGPDLLREWNPPRYNSQLKDIILSPAVTGAQ